MVNDVILILPLVILVIWASALLLVDAFFLRERKGLTALLAALGLVTSLIATLAQIGQEASAFSGMVMVDGFSIFLTVVLLFTGLAGIALSYDYLRRMGIERGEFYVLLLFSLGGMMLMTMAADLIAVFLALEWLSIPLYVLAGFARPMKET